MRKSVLFLKQAQHITHYVIPRRCCAQRDAVSVALWAPSCLEFPYVQTLFSATGSTPILKARATRAKAAEAAG